MDVDTRAADDDDDDDGGSHGVVALVDPRGWTSSPALRRRHPITMPSSCRVCGREKPSPGDVHCSRACAATGLDDVDGGLERAIVALLMARARGATICPSEACRVVFGDVDHDHMERTRRAARRLVAAGTVEITQRGVVVDPSRARGPLRLRRVEQLVEPARVGRGRRADD